MILIIDNYDSFTYNIFQALSVLAPAVEVVRNYAIAVDELAALPLTHLVVSPGPGRPMGAGISKEAVRRLAGRVPILGVCLGHQSIGEVFGGEVVHAARLMHGKTSLISHDGCGVFEGLPNPFEAIRYHSLALDRNSLPPDLIVTAEAEDGEVMGLRQRSLAVEDVQFHPESFGTLGGDRIFANFLRYQEPVGKLLHAPGGRRKPC